MSRSAAVEAAFGWSYLSREALARAKAQMDEESMGVRDEIGVLAVHQRYADRFFPGTSVLHTRVRYALFVPWQFEDLAGATGPEATRALRERERELAGRLTGSGVIGKRVYPRHASQPPSTVYWNALSEWGILRPRMDGRTISPAEAHHMLRQGRVSTDDDGQPLLGFDPPFVLLPERPRNWRAGPITLDLEATEAAFLRDWLSLLRRPDALEPCLLARLVHEGAAALSDMWADEVRAIAGPDRGPLARARQAASLAGVVRAVYAALLEGMIESVDGRSVSTRHRDHLVDTLREHGPMAAGLDIDVLEADTGDLPPRLRDVLIETKAWIVSGSKDASILLDPYAAAEARKGTRARLARTPDGRARRLEWSSDEHGLAEPLHYRWGIVSTMLDDLAAAK